MLPASASPRCPFTGIASHFPGRGLESTREDSCGLKSTLRRLISMAPPKKSERPATTLDARCWGGPKTSVRNIGDRAAFRYREIPAVIYREIPDGFAAIRYRWVCSNPRSTGEKNPARRSRGRSTQRRCCVKVRLARPNARSQLDQWVVNPQEPRSRPFDAADAETTPAQQLSFANSSGQGRD